jgi:hypothetical protein
MGHASEHRGRRHEVSPSRRPRSPPCRTSSVPTRARRRSCRAHVDGDKSRLINIVQSCAGPGGGSSTQRERIGRRNTVRPGLERRSHHHVLSGIGPRALDGALLRSVPRGGVMGGQRRTGRQRRATLVAAVGMVVVGSWFVVSSATGSTPPQKADKAATPSRADATGTTARPPATTTPRGLSPAVEPSTPSGAVTTSAPTTLPPRTPPPTNAAVPTTAPVTSRPTPLPRTVSRAAIAVPVAKPSTATAQAAVSLISALRARSNGRDAISATTDNIDLLGRWMANEGGLWADNPLNTSLDSAAYPHQFSANGQDTGIPIFPNLSVGVAATAATLLANPRYARILKVLGSGSAPCIVFARAVIQSPWASGHYDHDPGGFCSGRIVPARRGRGHGHHNARKS